ncbi:MAG: DNA gyrase inhibitor YacG [Burkholderiales bacterium]|nr:DNA gyrase inhibitor YacG [Burkholderiales bacterium]
MSTPDSPDLPARAARLVPCPTCGQQVPYSTGNPWRPFCSERCRSVDLGAWATERYRVQAQPDPDDEVPDTPAH